MNLQTSARRTRPRLIAAGTVLALGVAGLTAGAGAAQAVSGPVRGVRSAAVHAVALPKGPLTASGCTAGTATSACDLWATAGSLTLPGQTAAVPVWNFTSNQADVPTGTGPILVVNQGDAVTITLHNTIALAGNVSLAVPGMSGLVDDTTGVGAGSSKTYTFTASRPGTYLYEAGHTADGARQAAMGLVGALIVRPTDFGTATTDLGAASSPASAFTDEAVLVLSDLDPAFNNAVGTGASFDLRNFNGTYQMINGKVYPLTDPIASTAGSTVLLRYLNAGVVSHSMGTMGARQHVLAIDAHPSDGAALVADTLPPGETEDALVTVPAAGGQYAVYDTSGQLDTAGLTAAGVNRQLGFGGMMTFISTTPVAPPAPGPDTVGPISSGLSLSAGTAGDLTVTASFSDAATGGSNVAAAEALIDAQAPGSGVAFSGSFGSVSVTGATATIPAATLAALAPGAHTVSVRAQDSAGNWGTVATVPLAGPTTTGISLTPNPSDGTVSVALSATGDDSVLHGTVDQWQYSVDGGAPVVGTVASPATIVAEGATIAAGLAQGNHTVSVQSHDSFGLWGAPATITLTVDTTGPSVVSPAVTPNPTDGVTGDPVDPGTPSLKVAGTFTDATTNVVAAEGFLQSPTGTLGVAPTVTNGTGFTFLAQDGTWNSLSEQAYGTIPLSELTAYPDGTYDVWVHGQDAAGNWGQLVAVPFTITRSHVLFADTFERASGTLVPPWTSQAGAVAITAAARILGSYGLQVTGSGSVRSTLTGAGTPALTYHAQVLFDPQTLRSGGVDLLDARTAASGYVFRLQYRRGSATNAARQVRLMVYRSGGTTATGWITIPAGSSTLRVDWGAGSSATVTLTVNGAATALTGRNTAGLSIGSVQLGVFGGTASGYAYLDSFTSSLVPLP
jgi:hypothetical protein